MTSHPHQPSSDDADPDTETSPAGVAGDLERKAEEMGASVGPPDEPGHDAHRHASADPDSPGATIDDPEPAEPNEPG